MPLELMDIPHEIWLHMASFMELRDVISLRLTCRNLFSLTRDSLLWLGQLKGLARTEPIPPSANKLLTVCDFDTQPEVENLCRHIYRTRGTWFRARSRPWSLTTRQNSDPRSHIYYTLINDTAPRTILSLDVFQDRWLLVVYREALLELWDLYPQLTLPSVSLVDALNSPPSEAVCRARVQRADLTHGTACAASIMEDRNEFVVCITSEPMLTAVLRFSLDFSERVQTKAESVTLYTTPTPAHLIRAVLPDSNILVYSRSQLISILHMETKQVWHFEDDDDEEALWNGVIGAIPLTDQHLLCVKTRSVELMTSFPLDPSDRLQAGHMIEQELSETNFRGVSFSDPTICTSKDGGTSLSVTFLTFNALHGLYNYRVVVNLSDPSASDEVPISMEVQLIAVHYMAQVISPMAQLQENVRRPRSGLTPGSRGFVSACCLGAQGKRGIWVERHRNSVKRTVYGFRVDSDGNEGEFSEGKSIEGKCIYDVSSFDLRDDLTHCAFAESTGLVILGTRNGEVLLI